MTLKSILPETLPAGCGICPKCQGTGRREVPEHARRYVNVIAGYDKETDTLACDNCGGQTMFGRAMGYTKKRNETDSEGCSHEYVGRNAGRCYAIYTCKHCSSTYDIDSSD